MLKFIKPIPEIFGILRSKVVARFPHVASGEPGTISHVSAKVEDMLLFHGDDSRIVGMFFYLTAEKSKSARRGDFTVFVHQSYRRQGIATQLLRAALTRWPIDLSAQKYTPLGQLWIAEQQLDYQISHPEYSIPVIVFEDPKSLV
jgi:GNAT superfamily N-acetyltransferase